jgi:hypothetical protein
MGLPNEPTLPAFIERLTANPNGNKEVRLLL